MWTPILQKLQDLLLSPSQLEGDDDVDNAQGLQLQTPRASSLLLTMGSLGATAQIIRDAMAKCHAAIDSFLRCLANDVVISSQNAKAGVFSQVSTKFVSKVIRPCKWVLFLSGRAKKLQEVLFQERICIMNAVSGANLNTYIIYHKE